MAVNYTWIVDDDAIFTFTIRRMLDVHNLTHRIDIFPNGLEAKLQLEEHQNKGLPYPNVILLDINMPKLDGWQFMDEFVQFEGKENIIVYLVSSSIDPKDREKAARYKDIKEFVVKPVDIKQLVKIMKKAAELVNISQP